jgi:hypothetical protein
MHWCTLVDDSNRYSSEQFYGFIYGTLALWAWCIYHENAMAIILMSKSGTTLDSWVVATLGLIWI